MSYVVCVPHLQDGCGALDWASKGGHADLVQMLVDEFGFPPDTRDNVSGWNAYRHKCTLL